MDRWGVAPVDRADGTPLVSVITTFHNAPPGFFEQAVPTREPGRRSGGSCCSSRTGPPSRLLGTER